MLSFETVNILIENRLNDSKSWYDSHKEELRKLVLEPFFELISSLGPTMLDIDAQFVIEPKVTRTLSRIPRDTRYTHDKSKYRDSMWLYFRRDKNLYPNYPSFYFELTPFYVWWGCGLYFADSAILESYKALVKDRDPLFERAKVMLEGQQWFVFDEEDRYKRTKHPDLPEELRVWLDRKSLYVAHKEEEISYAFDPGFVEVLRRDFKALAPLYDFLKAACDRRF